jgi:Fe-S cluster assembly protein SufD
MSGTANAFLQGVSRLESKANGHHSSWLKALRRAAFEWVGEHGFPTSKDEAWKYTRVAPILEIPFAPAEPGARCALSPGDVAELAGELGGPRLVFVNGYFVPELSALKNLPEGVKLSSLASVFAEEGEALESPLRWRLFGERPQAFTALNVALSEDGAFIRIPARTTVEEPIHLVFISDAGATPLVSHPLSVVFAGAGSRATIVETHAGIAGGVYLSNAVTEIVLDEGAVVEHYKIQNEAESAFHLAFMDVRQGRASRFSAHSVAVGAALARHEVKVALEAPEAQVALNGLYLPRGRQLLDNPTTIEHAAPHCTSRQLYKGVVDGHGRGVFDGRIVVQPGAMKTDASQTNKNLLLSVSAQANTRPRLEIFADDVKCAHGAGVGQLDGEALYYLRTRGIPLQAARDLLTYAFASEMLELIQVPLLRSRVQQLLATRLTDVEKAGLPT